MAVTTTSTRVTYTGNGTTTVFAYTFRVLEASHILVYVNGLLVTSGYAVTGVGAATGGNVIFSTAPANGAVILFFRELPYTQPVSTVNNATILAQVLDTMVDRATMLIQQVREIASRALRFPITYTGSASLELPVPEANKVLGWNSNATQLQNINATDLATIIVAASARSDIFTGDGTTTAFNLSVNPGSQANLDVSVNGFTLLPGVDYLWSAGTTITFTTAPGIGDEVLVRYSQALPEGVVGDGTVTDAKVAAPSLLRNRNLDQVMLTDFMTLAEQNDYRSGANPDITQRIRDADAALADHGTLYVPRHPGRITGAITKKRSTWWVGSGSTVLATWTCQFNGDVITINGAGVSRDGGIENLRLVGNKTLYPASRLFNCPGLFTHTFKRIRAAGFNFGLYGLDCKALVFDDVYVFDCANDGVMLEGTAPAANTDHRFYDSQFTGDRYGLYGKTGATFKLMFSRPQSSGQANMVWDDIYDSQMIGGYCDSAIQHPLNAPGSPVAGNGDGIRIINSQRCLLQGVQFYSNGNALDTTRAMVRLAASAQCSDIDIVKCKATESPLAPMNGMVIQTPSGGGFYRRIRVDGYDLAGTNGKIVGIQNLGAGGYVKDCEGVSSYAALGDNLTSTVTIGAEIEVYRITGQNFNRNVVLPGQTNFVGKLVQVWFESGTGTVTIMQPDGTTSLATMTSGQRRTFVCRQSSNTITAALYA